MNFNNFTIKSQEAVQEAVNLVQSRGQQAIEPVHIMQGVMKAEIRRIGYYTIYRIVRNTFQRLQAVLVINLVCYHWKVV